MINNKIILIGTSIMLQKCIEISIKNFKKIFVVTSDKIIKKKFKKKVKFIKLYQIEKTNSDYLFSILNDKIISAKQLRSLKKNSFNFHDGPLPKYAGLFSSSWAIFNKEVKHGVCWHKIKKSIDTGGIFVEKKFAIKNKDTAYDIDIKGLTIGINLYKDLIKKIKNNNLKYTNQNLKNRTYFGKIKLKKLLEKFLKKKNNKTLIRSFTLSPQKIKLIYKFFKIKLKNPSINYHTDKKEVISLNDLKMRELIKIINKTLKINFKSNKKSKNLNKLALNNHPNWDSLAHVKLLSNIEKKFKIKIDESNINDFSNLNLMFKYFNKKII
jgi:methionyl-tRNA formyltransferase